MLTTAESALAIIAIFSFGALLIEARSHHMINKAMHTNVQKMFPDNAGGKVQANNDTENEKNTHRASPI